MAGREATKQNAEQGKGTESSETRSSRNDPADPRANSFPGQKSGGATTAHSDNSAHTQAAPPPGAGGMVGKMPDYGPGGRRFDPGWAALRADTVLRAHLLGRILLTRSPERGVS